MAEIPRVHKRGLAACTSTCKCVGKEGLQAGWRPTRFHGVEGGAFYPSTCIVCRACLFQESYIFEKNPDLLSMKRKLFKKCGTDVTGTIDHRFYSVFFN